MNGNRAGSAISAAIFAGRRKGASLKTSKRFIIPRLPQPMTLLLPPDNASSTKIETPSSTDNVSIPAASKTDSIEPLVAMPTSLHPVQPIATARQVPLAVKRVISLSRTQLAAA